MDSLISFHVLLRDGRLLLYWRRLICTKEVCDLGVIRIYYRLMVIDYRLLMVIDYILFGFEWRNVSFVRIVISMI